MRSLVRHIGFQLILSILLLGKADAITEQLRVGVYSNQPKIFIDEHGEASGIMVDILRKIAEKENWQLKFVPCVWQECHRMLNEEQLDLLPDVAYTQERDAMLDFHQTPALYSWSQIYRHPNVRLASFFDLQGKRVSVLAGSVQQRFFYNMIQNFGLSVELVPVFTQEEAFRQAETHEVDAAIANNYYGDLHARRFHLYETSIVFQPARLFYATKKGRHSEVLTAIDRYLNAWLTDPNSVYFDILRRWQPRSLIARIPAALWWGLGGITFLLLLTFALALLLRRQVAEKTRDLRDSEQKLATILDCVGSLIYIKDSQYRYQYVNRAVCELLRKPADEILGKSDTQLFDEATAGIFREKDSQVIEYGERVVAEEKTGRGASADTYLSIKIPLRRESGEIYALCGISTDITDRKQDEDRLRIAAAVFESQEGMFVAGPDKLVLDANRAFAAMAGCEVEKLKGKHMPLIALQPNGPDFREAMWRIAEESGVWQGEVWVRRENYEEYPAWLTMTAVRDANGVTTHYVGTQTDLTQRKQAQERIMQLAFYDPLTGLPNRRLLLERLQHFLSAGNRSRKTGALLFIDLDNFKVLNDTRSHEIGDQLLIQVAQRIVACGRESDTVARLGGDEFVVLLEGIEGSEQEAEQYTHSFGQKILEAVGRPYTIAGTLHHTTCSIGACLFSGRELKIDELMKRGDMAMYQAKQDGRNTLRFFHEHMGSAVAERAALEIDLREALRKSEFVLYYQAQVDSLGTVRGAEALLRWRHPKHGLLSPTVFIWVAEASSLIVPLGQWVLQTACRQLAIWKTHPATAHLNLSVNVSIRQFRHPEFVPQALAVIAEAGIDPARLKLELTETVLAEDIADTIVKMRSLKERGIGIALDDFGTGYSSLAYLKQLPIDQLKIDQSFVRDILSDANDAAIARSIVAMAQSLGLGIIAEGVETREQRDFLASIGCHAYQGYLYGRPAPAEELQWAAPPICSTS